MRMTLTWTLTLTWTWTWTLTLTLTLTLGRGSALECAAVLDAAEALGLTATEDLVEPMLTKLRAAA